MLPSFHIRNSFFTTENTEGKRRWISYAFSISFPVLSVSSVVNILVSNMVFLFLSRFLMHDVLITVVAAAMLQGALCASNDLKEGVDMKTTPAPCVRQTHGDGQWFPAQTAELRNMVNGFLAEATVPAITGRIVFAIAPHAGFIYSGRVAGATFRALKDNASAHGKPETAVLIGFTHRRGFAGVALLDGDAVRSPLGETPLDPDAAAILMKGRPRLFADAAPHESEHSAENLIPFAQAALPGARLVVMLMGDHDAKTIDQLVAALVELAKTKRIVVIASTDMLHDPDYDLVTRTDRETLKTLAALDEATLARTWSGERQTFCGIMGVLAGVRFARAQGCKAGTVLLYRNTGDDHPSSRGQWVVGYGAVVFAVP